jgi:hypothetical protein
MLRLLSSEVALPALCEGTCSCWLRHDSRKTDEGEDDADEDDDVDDDGDGGEDDGGRDDDNDGGSDDQDDEDDEETTLIDLLLLPLLPLPLPLLPPLRAGGVVGAWSHREPATMTAKCEK